MTDSVNLPGAFTDETWARFVTINRRGAEFSLLATGSWLAYALVPADWDPASLILTSVLAGASAVKFGQFMFEAHKDYVLRRRNVEALDRSTEQVDDHWASEEEKRARGMYDPMFGPPIGIEESGRVLFLPRDVGWSLINAPQGTGKTSTRAIVSAALSGLFKRKGQWPSVYITDPKEEIGPMIVGFLRYLGFEVVIDNAAQNHNARCPDTEINPFEVVIDCYWSDDPKLKAFASPAASTLAEIFAPMPGEADREPFFKLNQNRVARFLILKLAIDDPGHCTPGELYRRASDPRAMRAEIMEVSEWAEDDDALRSEVIALARQLRGVIEAPKTARYLNDFLQQLSGALKAYGHSGHLAKRGEYAAARLKDLRTGKKPIIYIQMNPLAYLEEWSVPRALSMMSLYMSTKIFDQARPIHFVLDEFLAMKIPNYHTVLTQLRGTGCSGEIYIQDSAGLVHIYDEEVATIIESQIECFQYLSFDNFDLATRVEKQLGTVKKKERTASTGPDGETRFDTRTVDVPLMTAQQLQALPKTSQVIKIRNMRPILCEKLPYWEIGGTLLKNLEPNPLEGPWPKVRKRIRLSITRNRIRKSGERLRQPKAKPARKRRPSWLPWKNSLWLAVPVAVVLAIETLTPFSVPVPAVRIDAGTQGADCAYLSLVGDRYEDPLCTSALVVPVAR